MNRLSSFVAALLTCVALLGCSSGSGSNGRWGISHSDIGKWVEDGREIRYSIVELRHGDRPYFVLASDISGRGGSSGGGEFTGLLQSEDRKLQWSCSTEDGVAGTVVIEGKQFDLTRGKLFLVRSEPSKSAAEQVNVALERLFDRSTADGFSDDAKAIPEVARFLRAVAHSVDDSNAQQQQ